MSLPKELEEAALLDGCNRFQIFGRIMLPLTKAGIVSLVIFTAKFAWNDFMWPLIVNTSMDKMTLGPALSTLQGLYNQVSNADGSRRAHVHSARNPVLHLPETVY